MSKSLQDVLRGADALEDSMRQLVRQRQSPPPLPQEIRPLSEEELKLIPRGMLQAADQCVKEAVDAATECRDKAQSHLDQVIEWGEALKRETKKAAESIASSHSEMLRQVKHFRAAMNGDKPEKPTTIIEEEPE